MGIRRGEGITDKEPELVPVETLWVFSHRGLLEQVQRLQVIANYLPRVGLCLNYGIPVLLYI